MGVKGLHSFIKENRQSLCTSLHLPSTESSSSTQHDRIAVVVDAWGIIFSLYLDSLPWCSGGEYLRFYRLVRRLVEAWRRAGLEPTFVFDGTTPPEKHTTILSRLQQHHKTALLFHTTSVSSRSSPSFSRSTTILPPFVAQAFTHALHTSKVETYFVPYGEADGLCVTIANRLHGYVFGNDSDFPILVSSPSATNVKGYCPLNMMMWIEGDPKPSSTERNPPSNNDGWSEWTSKPKRVPAPIRQSSFLPPTAYLSPTLVLTVIPPQALRTRLRLPASVLPLLASLIGNDYTPVRYAETFFENSLSPVQRVEKVARVLREVVFGSSSKAKNNAGDQAVDMVQKVIRKLAVRGFVSDSELHEMVDIIIEATFLYILPPLPDTSSMYPFDQTPKMEDLNENMDEDHLALIERAKREYSDLQKHGLASFLVAPYINPGRIYISALLEDPSESSLRATERLRDMRRQAWFNIEQGCGGLCWPEPTAEEIIAIKEDKEVQELLGVMEISQEKLDDNTADSDENTEDLSDSSISSEEVTLVNENDGKDAVFEDDGTESIAKLRMVKPRVIKEYIRQGSSQRIIETTVSLPPLPKIPSLPPCLEALDSRLDRYLKALSSDIPKVQYLPSYLHPLIGMLRTVILEISDRSGPRPDPKLRRFEVYGILKMGLGMLGAWKKEERVFRSKKDNEEGGWPALGSRQSGIMAQINAVMIDALLLAQSLLLLPENTQEDNHDQSANEQGGQGEIKGEKLKHPWTHLSPFMFISGVALHHLLNNEDPPVSTGWRWTQVEEDLLEKCAEAVIDGLESCVVGWKSSGQLKIEQSPQSRSQSQAASAAAATSPPGRTVKDKKKDKKKDAHASGGSGQAGGGAGKQMVGSRFELLNGIDM